MTSIIFCAKEIFSSHFIRHKDSRNAHVLKHSKTTNSSISHFRTERRQTGAFESAADDLFRYAPHPNSNQRDHSFLQRQVASTHAPLHRMDGLLEDVEHSPVQCLQNVRTVSRQEQQHNIVLLQRVVQLSRVMARMAVQRHVKRLVLQTMLAPMLMD